MRLGGLIDELQIEKYTESNFDKSKFSMITKEVEEEMAKRGFVAPDGSGRGMGAVTLVGIETHSKDTHGLQSPLLFWLRLEGNNT